MAIELRIYNQKPVDMNLFDVMTMEYEPHAKIILPAGEHILKPPQSYKHLTQDVIHQLKVSVNGEHIYRPRNLDPNGRERSSDRYIGTPQDPIEGVIRLSPNVILRIPLSIPMQGSNLRLIWGILAATSSQ